MGTGGVRDALGADEIQCPERATVTTLELVVPCGLVCTRDTDLGRIPYFRAIS